MIKKLIAALLSLSVALSLCACGGNDSASSSDNSVTSSSQAESSQPESSEVKNEQPKDYESRFKLANPNADVNTKKLYD